MSAETATIPGGEVRKACYAATKNKIHIAGVLQAIDPPRRSILEIASGTGEHAETFLSTLCSVELYQPSELDATMLDSIADWTKEFSGGEIPKCRAPMLLDVSRPDTHAALEPVYDCIICVNMVHISPPQTTADLFAMANRWLLPEGVVLLYGPFKVGGEMVKSNHAFDESLKGRNPDWGVRDLEWVAAAGQAHGFEMQQKVKMPANNLCVIFRRGQVLFG